MGIIYIFEKENMDIAEMIQVFFFFFFFWVKSQNNALYIYIYMNKYYKNLIITLKTKTFPSYGNVVPTFFKREFI